MKGPTRSAVFLERRAYHKRRMRDLARAVPIFGVVLWGIPLLWRQGEDGAANSNALIYIFAVWIVLIALAVIVSRAVRSEDVPASAVDPK